jgi:tetratricopeptide (TPR) repeat protein
MDDHLKQLILLGREHFQKGEYTEAEYLLAQVLERTDKFADVHHMLGMIAHSAGDFARAEHHFEQAVAINPNYTEAQLNLMVTYNDLGKYEAARRVYSTIRERDQHDPLGLDPFARGRIANMHADVAQAYVDAGLLLEGARELEKAVALAGFADLRSRLGVLYRDTGQPQLAREQFEAAKRDQPQFTPARLHLAVLFLRSGENAAAVRELEEVLALEPSNKSAQMYLRVAQARRESESPRR